MNKLCPCGSGHSYDECCGLIISAKKDAATCLELMRSRYVLVPDKLDSFFKKV